MACVIALNEADCTEVCLASLASHEDVVVVDSGLTDGARVLALRRVAPGSPWQPLSGSGPQAGGTWRIALTISRPICAGLLGIMSQPNSRLSAYKIVGHAHSL